MHPSIKRVKQAIKELQQGNMIVLQDDQSRENEGDLVMAAEHVTAKDINFMTLYGRGLVVMPMAASYFTHLQIPMMVQANQSHHQTAFGVSIGAASGITTGISAHDRALTIRTAANPQATRNDLVMPGHVFPLRAQSAGVLKRTGHTEGSVDLMQLAGLSPAAVLCEIMNPDGSMARSDDLTQFCDQHDISSLQIKDIVHYRWCYERLVTQAASSQLPLGEYGLFDMKVFVSSIDGAEYLVLTKGELTVDAPLVRLHSECLTGDVFGSQRCDCGRQLDISLQKIASEGGVLIYLRGHEGRGIGLANKVKAYALQDHGEDTVSANIKLGFSADQRDYAMGAQILKALGLSRIRLLTNNPAKVKALQSYEIVVKQRVAIESEPTPQNIQYLRTKRDKLGHILNKVEEMPCQ